MKRISAFLVLMGVCFLVEAHEFWLSPDKYFFRKGDKAKILFRVGENYLGEPWDLKRHRVETLELHQLATRSDCKSLIGAATGADVEIPLDNEGTQLVVLQSNNAFSDLEAKKFNAYLEEDGLDDALTLREKTNTMNKNGTEFYSRHAKLLLQVGEKTGDTFKKVVGLPIEIVPLNNPYATKIGEHVRCKILWEGKPLFGARVNVWHKNDNRTFTLNIYTEKDGTMQFPLSGKGEWMVSVVKMIPSKEKGADWQSYWGSFTFGIF